MTLALLTLALLVVCNGVGLAVSLAIDRKGLPESLDGQFAPRKRGSLQGRLPLILRNLAGLHLAAFVGVWLVSDFFVFARPAWWQVLLHVPFIVIVDDAWFYAQHRLLHENKWLYKTVHKLHHKSFAPVPIEYIYVHPLEASLGGIGPVLGVAALIALEGQMNAWTFLAWGAVRTLHELDIHSGTRSVLHRLLPFFAPTRHHDLHHAKPNAGNYASSLVVWDRLFGTEITGPLPSARRRKSVQSTATSQGPSGASGTPRS